MCSLLGQGPGPQWGYGGKASLSGVKPAKYVGVPPVVEAGLL